MARADETDALRGCPTCGTKVAEAKLGLRDYSRWLSQFLPGRVSGSDADTILQQESTGRMLVMEFKRKGEKLPTGQRLLLRAFVRKDIEVWVCWETDTHVEVGTMNRDGEVLFIENMTHRQLGMRSQKWWNAGLEDR